MTARPLSPPPATFAAAVTGAVPPPPGLVDASGQRAAALAFTRDRRTAVTTP